MVESGGIRMVCFVVFLTPIGAPFISISYFFSSFVRRRLSMVMRNSVEFTGVTFTAASLLVFFKSIICPTISGEAVLASFNSRSTAFHSGVDELTGEKGKARAENFCSFTRILKLNFRNFLST